MIQIEKGDYVLCYDESNLWIRCSGSLAMRTVLEKDLSHSYSQFERICKAYCEVYPNVHLTHIIYGPHGGFAVHMFDLPIERLPLIAINRMYTTSLFSGEELLDLRGERFDEYREKWEEMYRSGDKNTALLATTMIVKMFYDEKEE